MESNPVKTASVRYDWLDAVKAFAMLLVIFGHLGFSSIPVYQAYASFIKLPLFFAASGFVFSEKKTAEPLSFIKNRFVRIVLPYFFLCTLICVFNLVFERQSFDYWLNDSVHKVFTGSIYMWFLPVLFLTNVLMLVVFAVFKKNDVAIILSAFASLCLGFVLMPKQHILFDVNETLIAYPFCIFGYYFKRYIMHIGKKYLLIIASICLYLYIALPLLYKQFSGKINYINMYENHYTAFFFDIFIAFCGVIACFIFVSYFYIPKPVLWFGKNTMFYYAFHIPMYSLLMFALEKLTSFSLQNYEKGSLKHTLICAAVTVAAIFLLAPFCMLVNKYLPFLVGNPKPKKKSK